MAHERKELREAIVSQLKGPSNNRTAAGARVYETRQGPLRTSELPALSVYIDSETVTEDSDKTAPRELTRIATVAIEGWCIATTAVDDALDALALEIETAMDVDLNLGLTAFDSVLSLSEFGIKLDGERPMGCVHLEYKVTYHTDLRVAVAVDDFDTADIQYSLAGDQATLDQAHDTLTGIHE